MFPRPRLAQVVAAATAALLATSVGAVAAAPPASATTASATATLAPAADTYVTTGNPSAPLGRSVQLQASAQPGHVKTAYLRFNVPAYAGRKITAAQLVVTRDNHHLNSRVYANKVASTTWSETTTNLRSAPAIGTALDYKDTTPTTSTVSFNVMSAVRANAAVSIALTSKSTTDFASFRSREWGAGAPRLVLTTQPVPPVTPPTPPVTTSPGCVADVRGIPATGAYVGATVSGSAGDVSRLEAAAGAPMAIHRTYYTAGQVDWALATVQADLAAGRLPWISFKLPYSWADMAAGRGDGWVDDLADRLAQVHGPVWIAFHHEPEGDGPIQDWVRMQQHLAPIIHTRAPNVAYTIIVMTWDLFGPAQYRPDLLWPGDHDVDVLGLDMYNDYGTNRNGNPNIPMLDPMKYFSYFASFARAHHVPWALAETGYTTKAAQLNPGWLATEYADLVANGGIGLAYFDSSLNSVADWTLDTPAKLATFTALLHASPRICH